MEATAIELQELSLDGGGTSARTCFVATTSARVASVDLSETGNYVVGCLENGAIIVWDYAQQTILKSCRISQTKGCVRFFGETNFILFGSNEGVIHVLDMSSAGTELNEQTRSHSHSGRIRSLVVHSSKSVFASVDEQCIKLWDWKQNFSCFRTISTENYCVNAVAFHPILRHMLGAISEDGLRIFDLRDTDTLPCHLGNASAGSGHIIDFWYQDYSSSSVIISAGNFVRLWGTVSGQCVSQMAGHRGQINDVAFLHDLNMLATAGDDGTIRLWRFQSGSNRTTKVQTSVMESGMKNVCALATRKSRKNHETETVISAAFEGGVVVYGAKRSSGTDKVTVIGSIQDELGTDSHDIMFGGWKELEWKSLPVYGDSNIRPQRAPIRPDLYWRLISCCIIATVLFFLLTVILFKHFSTEEPTV